MLNNIIQKLKPFPHIHQVGMECGTTALATIFRYYGLPNLQMPLAEYAQMGDDGISMQKLAEIAQKMGFEAGGYAITMEILPDVPLPCVAHYGTNHFVVIYKLSAKHIWISDPVYGKMKLTHEKFIEKWKGVVLTILPTEETFSTPFLQDFIQTYREKQAKAFHSFFSEGLSQHKNRSVGILSLFVFLQILLLSVPYYFNVYADEIINTQAPAAFFSLALGLVACMSLHTLGSMVNKTLLSMLKIKQERSFFSKLFYHFLCLEQRFFDAHKREDLIYRFYENLAVRQFFNPNFFALCADFLVVPIYAFLLLSIHQNLFWAAAFPIILSLFLYRFFGIRFKSAEAEASQLSQKNFSQILDALLGMQSLKLLGLEHKRFEEWQENYAESVEVMQKSDRLHIGFEGIVSGLEVTAKLILLVYGGQLVLEGVISFGNFLFFCLTFFFFSESLKQVYSVFFWYNSLQYTLQKLNDLAFQKNEYHREGITEHTFPQNPTIQVENLSFRYHSSQEKEVLQHLTLEIPYGKKIGIVGRNGSGKSTFSKLLTSLYTHYEGKIRLGDVEIRSLSPAILRKNIFLFPQDVYIFNTTIAQNIACVKPNASQEEIEEAAQKADLDDFITSLYYQYDQRIGSGGIALSGGQRLKIGFARLFLSNPSIIILDEASSALDIETEKLILSNVYTQFSSSTIISIAHRLHTLKMCDEILVFDEGTILQRGEHQDLIQKEGLYRSFVDTYVNY